MTLHRSVRLACLPIPICFQTGKELLNGRNSPRSTSLKRDFPF